MDPTPVLIRPLHPWLIGCWLALYAMFGLAFVFESEFLLALPFLVAMPLAVVSYRVARGRDGALVRPWLYRAGLGVLVVCAFGTTVAAGATMMFGPSLRHLGGFVVLGTTNLVLAIATWRAVLQPSARKAATVGMFAVIVQLFAVIIDLVLNAALDAFTPPVAGAMATSVAFAVVTMGAGGLACIAALGSFAKAEDDAPATATAMPEARVVDD